MEEVGEVEGARQQVADEDPGSGSGCIMVPDPINESYQEYFFGNEDDFDICTGDCGEIENTIRRC